jgi:hypothetical protein
MPATTYPSAKSPQKYKRSDETSFEPVRDGDPHHGPRHHPLYEQPYRSCKLMLVEIFMLVNLAPQK